MGAGYIPDSILQKINLKMRAFFWNSGSKHKMRLVTWENITTPKFHGGLGLRDATVLNRAMIMKTIWRIASRVNDEALWVQVLKAKYLSRANFWLASMPARCSKYWRAILLGRQDLHQHVRWIIGDGTKCSLVGTPWHHFWLKFMQATSAALKLTIADCIDQQTGEWNSSLLISALGFHAALFIACVHPIPPIHPHRTDRLIFTPTNSGSFSFKGACNLIQSSPQPNLTSSAIWKLIWKCQGILPRIRLFLWKLTHDAVPVKYVFARHLRTAAPPCEICGLGSDDAIHSLFFCSKAEQSWLNSSIGLRVHALPVHIIPLLKLLSEQLTQHDFLRFANHLWALWKARCKEVYEGKRINVQQVSSLANSYTFLADVGGCGLNTRLRQMQVQNHHEMSICLQGNICRLDGSFHNNGTAGWAYTLFQDEQLLQYGLESGEAMSPLHVEALAMLAATKAVYTVGWSSAIFLTDC
ncbi:RNA-directed DNA polymerase (reverse transcriptase)-related family protein [Rhynchospora pubera]|uniref:RNA-directed DNA polymerase (Reverse transcriptase)-related family protein n=1 Tax=Rhynchospora pubera TaxID=906938 RepID=A0AAV8F203_9POAL|nr:RNA-directed DNA polymerase (reverse transcriptase)-related family protein [Rhynchospora pubera]